MLQPLEAKITKLIEQLEESAVILKRMVNTNEELSKMLREKLNEIWSNESHDGNAS